jgi:tetratricopeptide (TPR) repeat protein
VNRPSHIPHLLLVLLLIMAFSLSARLVTEELTREPEHGSQSLTVMLLGDSRRLFANHFFSKADEYFHAGYYPSIFDQAAVANKGGGSAVATGAITGDAHAGEVEWQHEPRDWIERFSRNFFPSEHMHLDEMDGGDHDHYHDHDHGHGHAHDHAGTQTNDGSAMREILPWLRISAELDPNRIETYVTGAYWLRKRMNRVAEAEEFVRDGLRANPKSYALVYELARIQEEHHRNVGRARNLYQLALRYWDESQRLAPEPDHFLLAQILGQLATLERRAGNPARAVELLRELRKISPNPAGIDHLIQDTEAGKPPITAP